MASHVKEGDIEEVWFWDTAWTPDMLPFDLTITTFGFDIRANNKFDVVVRVFVPKWWSNDQRNDLAHTYMALLQLKAENNHGVA